MLISKLTSLMLAATMMPAPAIELSGDVLKLSDEERVGMTKCEAEGGCHIITSVAMMMVLKHAYELGETAGKKEGCKGADAGPTPLVAVMRAFVTSKIGDDVELP